MTFRNPRGWNVGRCETGHVGDRLNGMQRVPRRQRVPRTLVSQKAVRSHKTKVPISPPRAPSAREGRFSKRRSEGFPRTAKASDVPKGKCSDIHPGARFSAYDL